VRHESNTATTAPGVTPSKNIINQHPYTLLIVGHTHTYQHNPADREVVVGIGGAPLTTGVNYGYGVVERNAEWHGSIHRIRLPEPRDMDRWSVASDGSPALATGGFADEPNRSLFRNLEAATVRDQLGVTVIAGESGARADHRVSRSP